jgi:hypothetical protein
MNTEVEFLDVIGTKVVRVFTSTYGFYSSATLSKSGLKPVCKVNIAYRNLNLRTLKTMPRNLNEIQEFG